MTNGNSKALLIVLLLWMWSNSNASSTPEAPAPRSGNPSMIDPGWWWYWYEPKLDADVATWRKAKRGVLSIRRTFGSASLGATVIVFEVRKRFRWTLPGLPEQAPRGQDTDLSDVAWAIPAPPSALKKMAEAVAQATWTYLRQLYQGRRPPREPFPGGD